MSRLNEWFQQRLDVAGLRRDLLDRNVPDRLTWWHTLGSATLAALSVQVITGVVLAMYYAPSPDHAYDSIRYIDHQVMGGALLRGMHHWGASAMVVLAAAHMIRVFSMGAYKFPREINWLVGVGLLFLVLGFGFTGYLLPWDEKAYWATQVGTNIAGTTPIVGSFIVRLLRGGTQLGAATLTRFFAFHVLLLPLIIGTLVLIHMVMVVRQGIAPRTTVLEDQPPPRTDDPAYAGYYQERYKASKGGGKRFWPDVISKDIVVATAVVLTIVVLAKVVGAGLEPPADPTDTSYVPRPEWYFLPFFQLLKLVPGSMEAAVAVGFPAAIVIVMLALPFFDRRSMRSLVRRPVALASLTLGLGALAFLLGASFQGEVAPVAPETGRPLTTMERAGHTIFQAQQCGGCHAVGSHKPKKDADTPDAPDLTEVGLRHSLGWMHSFMEDPSRFHPDSKMPPFGPPKLSHQEIEEVARYLGSLRGPDWATKKPQIVDTFPEPVRHMDHQE